MATNAQSTVEAPAEAIDRVYAQTMFDLVSERHGREELQSVEQELHMLDTIRRADPKLAEFFRSRIISGAAKVKVLGGALQGRCSDLVRNLILVLARKERLDRFAQVVSAYSFMVQEQFGKVEVSIYTPAMPDEATLNAMKQRLQQALGREPVMKGFADPAMIGGLRMQVGDKLIDASVLTRLRRMREQLLLDGAAAIRTRADRMLEG